MPFEFEPHQSEGYFTAFRRDCNEFAKWFFKGHLSNCNDELNSALKQILANAGVSNDIINSQVFYEFWNAAGDAYWMGRKEIINYLVTWFAAPLLTEINALIQQVQSLEEKILNMLEVVELSNEEAYVISDRDVDPLKQDLIVAREPWLNQNINLKSIVKDLRGIFEKIDLKILEGDLEKLENTIKKINILPFLEVVKGQKKKSENENDQKWERNWGDYNVYPQVSENKVYIGILERLIQYLQETENLKKTICGTDIPNIRTYFISLPRQQHLTRCNEQLAMMINPDFRDRVLAAHNEWDEKFGQLCQNPAVDLEVLFPLPAQPEARKRSGCIIS